MTRDILDSDARQRAEIRDLKARLEAVAEERDAALAREARMREVLEDAVEASVQWVVDADANNPRSVSSLAAYREAMEASAAAQRERAKAWEVALSEPVDASMRSRDRALALKVAEAVYREAFSIELAGDPLSDADRARIAVIVDEVLK